MTWGMFYKKRRRSVIPYLGGFIRICIFLASKGFFYFNFFFFLEWDGGNLFP